MRLAALLFMMHVCCAAHANMASPYQRGTESASAISSRYIDILSETIQVTPDSLFETARFLIKYRINCDSAGTQIPLLFYAVKYKDDFAVTVDGVPEQIRGGYMENPDLRVTDYVTPDTSFKPGGKFKVQWTDRVAGNYDLNDLKYFEADLGKGPHTIEVSYVATQTVLHSGWVKNRYFTYSLMPAKFWRSFGTLDIILDARGCTKNIYCDLGAPHSGKTDSVAKWSFTRLPAEEFELHYKPNISKLATLLITITPELMAMILLLLLFVLHVWYVYSKAERASKRRAILLWGFVVPLVFLFGYLFCYSLVDMVIGPDANTRHGYLFLVFVFYPILAPVYMGMVWLFSFILTKGFPRASSVNATS